MARKFDLEDVIRMILSVMQTDSALDVKIAAIEAEKTAAGYPVTPTLAPIKLYHEQSWSDKVLRATPAIFYGVEDITAEAVGDAVKKTYRIFVEVVMVDSGQRNDGYKRINRYSRALEELFAEKFADAFGYGQMKIEQVRPIAFKLNENTDDEVKTGGVSLTINIA